MILPCIDLKANQVVQLRQGKELALSRPLEETITAFEGFDLIHVIDLDAALGQGDNREIVREIARRRKTRVGGGVRSISQARSLLDAGATELIVGSQALTSDGPNIPFLERLVQVIGRERIIIALDLKAGGVATHGWTRVLPLDPTQLFSRLEPYCAGFLCTHVDREGLLQGADIDKFLALRAATDLTLIAAGGVTTLDEVKRLAEAGLDVALGMAVYTGSIAIEDLLQLERAIGRRPVNGG